MPQLAKAYLEIKSRPNYLVRETEECQRGGKKEITDMEKDMGEGRTGN